MTKTEDRLTDALAAVAQVIREETLPPLPVVDAGSGRRVRWGRWLAPVAAAVAVILIVVLLSAVHLFGGKPPGGPVASAGPPRYYASVEAGGGVVIRATATGALTGQVPNKQPANGSFGQYAMSVAAADGGREFVVAEVRTVMRTHQQQTRLYSFHLTSAGHVTGLSLVKGGVLTGLLAGRDMAVSPDGSKVALTVYPPPNPRFPPKPAEIVVVNLRTGARSLWQGGLERAGLTLNIPSISWAPGDHSLAFLALWCRQEIPGSGFCQPGPHADTRSAPAQVRTLPLAAGGGLLSQGRVLLSQSARYPYIVQALLSPSGKAITMVVLRGPYSGQPFPVPQHLQVVQVPLAGGRLRQLYYAATDRYIQMFLGADASGQHLLLAWLHNGWIDHGTLRPLAPGVVFSEAW